MRTLRAPAVIAVVAICLVAAADAYSKGETEPPVGAIAAGRDGIWAWLSSYELVRVDPRANRVTARTDTSPALIADLAVGEGGVWAAGRCGVFNCRYGILMRFDPRTGRRTRPLTLLGLHPRGVAAGHGAVWVLGGRRVLRIDPRTRRLAGRPIPIGRNAQDIAVGAGAVWATLGPTPGRADARCSLVGVAPRTGRVFRRQRIPCGASELSVDARRIWALASRRPGFAQVRPRGPQLAPTAAALPGSSTDVAAGRRRAWFTGVGDPVAGPNGEARSRATLTRVDAATGAVGEPIPLGETVSSLPRVAVAEGAVWVANTPTGTLTRVDPATRKVVTRIALGRPERPRTGLRSVAAAMIEAAAADRATSRCGAASRAAAGLPAPVIITRAGRRPCSVRVDGAGRVRQVPVRPSPPAPSGSVIFPLNAPGLAVIERRGRLVVVPARGGPPLWRSAGRGYDRPGAHPWVTGVAVSPGRVAVSVFDRPGGEGTSRLLMAPRDGEEREVAKAAGEAPVGWTAAGDLITREGRARLRLRGPDGRFLADIARGRGGRAFDWDPRDRTAVVVDRGSVRRVGSGGDVVLADLAALGLEREAHGPSVEVAERGRIVLVGRRALVVLRPDGSLWARVDHPRGGEIAGQASLRTSPDGTAIAYANVRHGAGVMTVELLREGSRSSQRLLRRTFTVRPPGWSTGLAWRGRWLLSWSGDGSVAALRPGTGRRVELAALGRSLLRAEPGSAGIEARWGP